MPRSPYQKSIEKNLIYLSREQEERLFNTLIDKRKELRYLLLNQIETAWYVLRAFEQRAFKNKSSAKLSSKFNSKKIGLNSQLKLEINNNITILANSLSSKYYGAAQEALVSFSLSDEFLFRDVAVNAEFTKPVSDKVNSIQEEIKALEDTAIRTALAAAYEVGSRYKNATLDLMIEDNMQEANVGLLEAVRLYDPNKGIKFITYAYLKCDHAVKDALMMNSRHIRLPRNRLDSVFAVATGLKQTKGRVTVNRIKKETNKLLTDRGKPSLTKEEVEESLNHLYDPAVRMDEKINDSFTDGARSHTIGDTIQDPNLNPEEQMEFLEQPRSLDEMMIACGLDDIEKNVLKIKYQTGDSMVSNKEIGDRINRSGEKVRQIEMSAIAKLQKQSKYYRHLLKYLTREP